MSKIALEALGGESGKYLSHAKMKFGCKQAIKVMVKFSLKKTDLTEGVHQRALVEEVGKYLLTCICKIWLQDGVQGEGEEWICHDKGNGNVAFECLGKETGLFLSHAFDKMWLQDGYQGEGELWAQQEFIALEALGAEKGSYLSHAKDEVWLQNGNQGDGEVFIKELRPNGRVALACLGKKR